VKIEVNNNGFIKNSYFKVEFKEPEMKKDKKDSIEISREAREMQKLKVAPKNLFMIKEKIKAGYYSSDEAIEFTAKTCYMRRTQTRKRGKKS